MKETHHLNLCIEGLFGSEHLNFGRGCCPNFRWPFRTKTTERPAEMTGPVIPRWKASPGSECCRAVDSSPFPGGDTRRRRRRSPAPSSSRLPASTPPRPPRTCALCPESGRSCRARTRSRAFPPSRRLPPYPSTSASAILRGGIRRIPWRRRPSRRRRPRTGGDPPGGQRRRHLAGCARGCPRGIWVWVVVSPVVRGAMRRTTGSSMPLCTCSRERGRPIPRPSFPLRSSFSMERGAGGKDSVSGGGGHIEGREVSYPKIIRKVERMYDTYYP